MKKTIIKQVETLLAILRTAFTPPAPKTVIALNRRLSKHPPLSHNRSEHLNQRGHL